MVKRPDSLDVFLLFLLVAVLVLLLVTSCTATLSPQTKARLDKLSHRLDQIWQEATKGNLPWKDALLLMADIKAEIKRIEEENPNAGVPEWLQVIFYSIGTVLGGLAGKYTAAQHLKKRAA